jgi:hypothetical protein
MEHLEDIQRKASKYAEQLHPEVYRSFHTNSVITETPENEAPF